MKLALLLLLASSKPVLLAQAPSAVRCAVEELAEAQVCYVRCQGGNVSGSLTVAGTLSATRINTQFVDAGVGTFSGALTAQSVTTPFVDAGVGTFSGALTAQSVTTPFVDAGAVCIGGCNKWDMRLSGNDLQIYAPGNNPLKLLAASGILQEPYGYQVSGTTDDQFECNASSGNRCFVVATNGARIDFGAGANDYASSDGTTVTFAGPLSVTGNVNSSASFGINGLTKIFNGQVTSSDTSIRGNVANSAGVCAVTLGNATGLTAGSDRYAVCGYSDSFSTQQFRINSGGGFETVGVGKSVFPNNFTTCTLNGASPSTCTATVTTGATCGCSPVGTTAAIAAGGCAVSLSSTTLTATSANGLTNVVNIWCNK